MLLKTCGFFMGNETVVFPVPPMLQKNIKGNWK